MKRCLWLLLNVVATLLFIAASPAWAASVATTPHFTAQLVPESRTPAPGASLAVLLVIRPAAGWHTYWKNPGGTGFPPELDWQLPRGVSAGHLRYPVPTELIADGIASNVLEGTTRFLTHLTLTGNLSQGLRLPVGLHLRLLICSKGMCVPQTASLDLPLRVGEGTIDGDRAGLFARARAALPIRISGEVGYVVDTTGLRLSLPASIAAGASNVRAFISNDGVMPEVEHTSVHDGRLTISMPSPGLAPGTALQGVVRVAGPHNQVTGYQFTALPRAPGRG